MKEIKYKPLGFFRLYLGLTSFQIKNLWNLIINLGMTKRKMDSINKKNIAKISKNKEDVVNIYLHGILQDYHSFLLSTVNWFQKRGMIIIPIGYDYTKKVKDSAIEVSLQIDSILKRSGAKKINLIGISYGSVVARYYSENLNGYKKINKLITVGGPYYPIKKTKDMAYKLDKLVGGDPDDANKFLKMTCHKNSVKNHLAIHMLNDIVITRSNINCPNVKEIWVKGGHSPSSHYPERLQIILDYLKN